MIQSAVLFTFKTFLLVEGPQQVADAARFLACYSIEEAKALQLLPQRPRVEVGLWQVTLLHDSPLEFVCVSEWMPL